MLINSIENTFCSPWRGEQSYYAVMCDAIHFDGKLRKKKKDQRGASNDNFFFFCK